MSKVQVAFDGPGWGGAPANAHTYIEEVVTCNCGGKTRTRGGVQHPAEPHDSTQDTRVVRGDILEADLADGSMRSHNLKRAIEETKVARILPKHKPAPREEKEVA